MKFWENAKTKRLPTWAAALAFSILASACYQPNFTPPITSLRLDKSMIVMKIDDPEESSWDIELNVRPRDVSDGLWAIWRIVDEDIARFDDGGVSFSCPVENGTAKATIRRSPALGAVPNWEDHLDEPATGVLVTVAYTERGENGSLVTDDKDKPLEASAVVVIRRSNP